MRVVLLCLVLACALGCRSQQPAMPAFQTEQGKANARVCLDQYNTCLAPCSIGGSHCVARCHQLLSACYQVAE